uniref:SH2 domain-containing protein n=1 Tax=Gasterosteus aculeatus aculeatus TaxID=481459 RepID=A0AAQ4R640_GASAC
MTPGSNHELSRKAIERNFCVLYRQQKPRSERTCRLGTRTKEQRQRKSPHSKTCRTFLLNGRVRMEQREPTVDCHSEGTEGRLKELASRWFIETQMPLIVHNGFFPTWFLGFITRKEAEEILREKELGCFLIRLSDKAMGYILSYKGQDRCRHFVINQSESGQFVVCGDTEGHDSVADLIEYYKSSPIQPFGEYLASSCFEALDEELYDFIQVSPKEKPLATDKAVKPKRKPLINSASEQPPARPPKGNRTQEASIFRYILEEYSNVYSTQKLFLYLYGGMCSSPSAAESVYSQLGLLDSKSRSLPLLDNIVDGEQSYRLRASPLTPPRLSPKPVRENTSVRPLPETTDSSSSQSLEHMGDSAVYLLAGRPGSPPTTSSATRYAEVPMTSPPHENTYERIPGHEEPATPEPNCNTYEPLEDIRPKHKHSSFGLKNDKWKWLFPEVKRKW